MTEASKPPLNVGRVVLVFAVLPVVLGLDRWAYWGARSMLPLHLRSLAVVEYANFITVQSALGAVSLLVGGALAIGTGPALTLALGALLSVVGYAVLAASSGTTGTWAAMVVLALGQGLAKPSVFALAAVELGHPRSHLRSAACVALYAVTNVSALVSSSAAGAVAARAGVSAAFVSSAVLAGVSTFFAVVFVAAWYLMRPKADAPPPASPLSPAAVAIGAGLVIAVLAPYHVALSLQSAVVSDFARVSSSAAAVASLFSLNPIAVLCVSLLAIPVLVVLHLKGTSSLSFFALGAGLCLTGLAFAPMLLAKTSYPALGATELGVGAAEVLVGPIALSRVAGDLPPRFATAGVALYQCVATFAGMLASLASRAFHGSGPLIAGVLALVLLALGVALLAGARPLTRALYRVEPVVS